MWRYFTKKQSVRYVDVLHDCVRSYNNMFHRTIGMAPSEVNATNQEGLATPLRSQKCGNTKVPSWRLRAHQQSEATVQERLHGKLDRRVVYDRRSSTTVNDVIKNLTSVVDCRTPVAEDSSGPEWQMVQERRMTAVTKPNNVARHRAPQQPSQQQPIFTPNR